MKVHPFSDNITVTAHLLQCFHHVGTNVKHVGPQLFLRVSDIEHEWALPVSFVHIVDLIEAILGCLFFFFFCIVDFLIFFFFTSLEKVNQSARLDGSSQHVGNCHDFFSIQTLIFPTGWTLMTEKTPWLFKHFQQVHQSCKFQMDCNNI